MFHQIIEGARVQLAQLFGGRRPALLVQTDLVHALFEVDVAFLERGLEVGASAGIKTYVMLVAAGGDRFEVGDKHFSQPDLPGG
jgi:hypothetical protein